MFLECKSLVNFLIHNTMALTKSKDKKIAGVCGGIAEHFGWDVSIFRIAYLVATILTGSALAWIYLILMFVLSDAK